MFCVFPYILDHVNRWGRSTSETLKSVLVLKTANIIIWVWFSHLALHKCNKLHCGNQALSLSPKWNLKCFDLWEYIFADLPKIQTYIWLMGPNNSSTTCGISGQPHSWLYPLSAEKETTSFLGFGSIHHMPYWWVLIRTKQLSMVRPSFWVAK